MKNDNILFLLNPYSGDEQGRKSWERARQKYTFLPSDPIDVTKHDIKKLITQQKPKVIVIAGGDGTVNTVSSIVSQLEHKPILSIFPFGYGNALSYCFGVETIDKAVDTLLKQKKKVTIDLMKTNIKEHERGAFNIGIGFDARIVFNRKNNRYIGFRSYVFSALQSWIAHPENEMTFTIDRKVTLTAKASSLVVANCPVIGQNYIVAPNAKMNDGMLDCTFFSTKYAYLANIRLQGFKHPLYTELGKVRFKASHIRIEGEPFVQIDGDSVVYKDGIEIEIMPSQVTFLRNSDENINQMYLPFVS